MQTWRRCRWRCAASALRADGGRRRAGPGPSRPCGASRRATGWRPTAWPAPPPGARSAGAAARRSAAARSRAATSGWDVAALQFRLAWHGFPSGSIDGGFGSHVGGGGAPLPGARGPDGRRTAGPATLRALSGPMPRSPIWLVHPVRGSIGDRFGPRGNRFHTGVDYPGAGRHAGDGGRPRDRRVRRLGLGRVRQPGRDRASPRGALDVRAPVASIGVNGRGPIGRARARRSAASARPGVATGPHLHFELRLGGAAIDPLTALR